MKNMIQRERLERDRPEKMVKDMEGKRLERDKPDKKMKNVDGKEVRVR